MANIFPYLGHFGGTDTTGYPGAIHDYDDNTEREYYGSPNKRRTIVIPFKNISKTKRDILEAFYNVNKKLDVFVYVWPEAQLADLAGNTGTGRHMARIRGDLVITNNQSCTYSTEFTFKLKD